MIHKIDSIKIKIYLKWQKYCKTSDKYHKANIEKAHIQTENIFCNFPNRQVAKIFILKRDPKY